MDIASRNLDSVADHEIFLDNHPSVSRVDLLIPDINGILRGKRVERASLKKVFEKGIFLTGSLFALDLQGNVVEETGIGLEQGDFDCRCRPIAGSLATIPWQGSSSAQLLMTMYDMDGQPFFADPRHLLTRMLDQVLSLGLKPVTAVELEFYVVDKNRPGRAPLPPVSPATGRREQETQVYSIDNLDEYSDFLGDVIAASREQGLPADTIIAEYAPGQFEVNLHHVDNPILACDHAILLKRVIRQVATRHGMEATFMAKPYADQAGSGMHVHISLLDDQGNNILADKAKGVSQTLEHAVGGLLATMADSMALLAPNINSYRRFKPEFYTPMAPTWGIDNRSTALRIPAGDPENTRIEYRVPGADANPYLVMAVILSSIHYGISNKVEPPAATTGNAVKQHPPTLPSNIRDALRTFKSSEILKSYLSEEFINMYTIIRRKELEEFESCITSVEHEWLLNTI